MPVVDATLCRRCYFRYVADEQLSLCPECHDIADRWDVEFTEFMQRQKERLGLARADNTITVQVVPNGA